ncbi:MULTISPECIES: S49 family peptidase [Methylobacterium]|jgi:ClpP class serine protease|uniref:S49 family peptidase n=1 Tax=Methylobacterium TaxID=407 RepID=UPI0008E22F72|nr:MULTISPECIES: S49 family peptidase [Methylobacterium]MBZ6415373.1 S49 family peptidase [Methylobacterium sp.]MBK3397650.1 S49 family peptidase [Methylobacterium ajmalii]MBK3412495.1 S49 family peptidase [Methylobacterium ajmalii]MBK3426770.1 S49 family peptidase [Methylobacterium ajmalii]SFF67748.1 Peptidase family S49 [Methylobacterium sp. yr596]
MISALHALTAEPWAIRPDYLHFMASLASLDRAGRADRRAAEGEDWFRLDLQAAAGPTAQRLDGARYAMLTREGVAVIPIVGPIFPRANLMTEMSGTGASTAMLARDLSLARDSADVGAIMLLVDSPGGSPTGINALADQLYALRGVKRVVAHVSGSAASAAYWIASSAGELVTDKTGMLGSIGVVAALSKQVEPDATGSLSIEIVSSNAPNKRPDPQSEDGAGQVRALLDGIEAQFIADVARGRKTTPARVRTDFGAGGMKVGADAVAAGMADRVRTQDATLKDLSRTAANERAVRATRR